MSGTVAADLALRPAMFYLPGGGGVIRIAHKALIRPCARVRGGRSRWNSSRHELLTIANHDIQLPKSPPGCKTYTSVPTWA